MTSSTTLGAHGEVTLPRTIVEALGLRPGDRVDFIRRDDGQVIVVPAKNDVRRLRGIVKYDGPPVTIEQMNAAIEEGAGS